LPGPVIIGGGPAGAAAAIALARGGHGATLIERSAHAADKVCGDFLSNEAVAMIEAFGVDLAAASTITALRLVHRNRVATTPLPFTARGLSRRVLDEALLRRAAADGATVLRGHRVAAIGQVRGALRIDCASLGRVDADTVFVATGKHELRGTQRTDRGTGLVGCKMYYRLCAPQHEALRHHVELALFPGGYAGLQLVEADRAVLCTAAGGDGARSRRTVGQSARRADRCLSAPARAARRRRSAARPAIGGRRSALRLCA
jgi:flavin-dependent dehydrogenase